MNFWGIFRSWLWSIDVLGEAGVDCGFFCVVDLEVWNV